MQNKKASVMIYSVMLGVVVIILALALAPAGKQVIGSAMNVTVGDSIGMDCGNSSISNFDKATCTAVDITLPYFIGFLLFLSGAIVVGRIIFSGE